MVNGVRFLISEEDLALGLISQELLCGRVLLKCEKGTEKASDTDIRRGRSVSPSLVFQFSSVQSLSRVRLVATSWIAARQASLSITNSQSLLRLMSIKSVMPSSHLILCRPLLLLPPIPPSIRVFSNEWTLHMRWSFSFSISPSNEHPGLIKSLARELYTF